MKKVFVVVTLTFALFSFGKAQNPNENNQYNNDDVYYQGDDNNDDQNNTYTDNNEAADNGAPTYQTFYDQLSPYGSWVNYPGYGYVWAPNQVPGDFSPYATGGRWAYTDYGWTWVSDYAWGWGPYHYGRWFYDDFYGWMWMPGYNWAPAWVIWGNYGGYYCWAPIGPREYVSPHYRPNPNYWHFVERGNIGHENINNYVVRNEVVVRNAHVNNVTEITNHVNIINHANTYNQGVFFAGPKANEVEKYSGQKITKVAINNVSQPQGTKITGNQINMYRPAIPKQETPHGAPKNLATPQQLKPVNNAPNNRATSPLLEQKSNPVRSTPTPTPTPATRQPVNEPVQRQQQQQQERIQQWTPPRQSTPQRQAPVQQQPQRNYSPPPQQHYSPPPMRQSTPAPAPSRGGGRR